MIRSLLMFLSMVISFSVYADAGQFKQFTVRGDVTIPTWFINTQKPVASAILLAGGKGKLNITAAGIGRQGNFLIRSRDDFLQNNISVLIPDIPSDKGNLFYYRTTKSHAEDLSHMIMWLRQTYPQQPVWLIGTSRGTISAANAAVRLDAAHKPDGIVLSASLTRASNSGLDSLSDVALDKLDVPTLLVHHEQDECYVTPYQDIPALLQTIPSKRKALLSFVGGVNRGPACESKGFHGFNGIEPEVVNAISDWIKKN